MHASLQAQKHLSFRSWWSINGK